MASAYFCACLQRRSRGATGRKVGSLYSSVKFLKVGFSHLLDGLISVVHKLGGICGANELLGWLGAACATRVLCVHLLDVMVSLHLDLVFVDKHLESLGPTLVLSWCCCDTLLEILVSTDFRFVGTSWTWRFVMQKI